MRIIIPGIFIAMVFLACLLMPACAQNPVFPTKSIVFLSPHPDDIPLTFDGLVLNSEGFNDAPVRHYSGSRTAAGGPGGDFRCFKEPE